MVAVQRAWSRVFRLAARCVPRSPCSRRGTRGAVFHALHAQSKEPYEIMTEGRKGYVAGIATSGRAVRCPHPGQRASRHGGGGAFAFAGHRRLHGGVFANRRIDAASAAGAGAAQAGWVHVPAAAHFAGRAAGRRSLQLSTARAISAGGRRAGGALRDDGVGTAAIGGFRQRGDAGTGARAVDLRQRTGHAGRPPGAGAAADGSG